MCIRDSPQLITCKNSKQNTLHLRLLSASICINSIINFTNSSHLLSIIHWYGALSFQYFNLFHMMCCTESWPSPALHKFYHPFWLGRVSKQSVLLLLSSTCINIVMDNMCLTLSVDCLLYTSRCV